MDNILSLHPAAPGSILGIPTKIFLDAAEINRQQWLEQWTEAR